MNITTVDAIARHLAAARREAPTKDEATAKRETAARDETTAKREAAVRDEAAARYAAATEQAAARFEEAAKQRTAAGNEAATLDAAFFSSSFFALMTAVASKLLSLGVFLPLLLFSFLPWRCRYFFERQL